MDCMTDGFFVGACLAMRMPPLAAPSFEHLHLVAGGAFPGKITEERGKFDTEEAFP
jgi:hypothetical protein